MNDVSHDVQKAELEIAKSPNGTWSGRKIDSGKPADGNGGADLQSVAVGGDRLWAVADSPFGSMEFRLMVRGNEVSGYWAGPFGQNGTLRGIKLEASK